MPTTKKNINFDRARFDLAAKFYSPKGIAPQTAQIRVLVPLAGGTGNLKFDIKKDPSLAHVCEQLLKRTDLFIARAMGLGLMVEVTAAKGSAPLYSYPVQAGLALPAGLKGFSDTNAFAIYNGVLTMKTGQSVNYSRFPVSPCLNIPITQPQAVLNSDDVVVSNDVMPAFNAEDIMFELPEVLVFAGTKEQPITLEFPATAITSEANTTAYAMLIIEGWLLEGATTEDMHSPANPFNDNF